ncbi:MAG: Trk system potassium transporter TrkA [Gemmatimonadetes bacterium]|nr:Trk system potassium transporter TrkA [Gemmatimonadota bacterium]
MRIIIIGAGEVGFHLARRLSEEGQDVVMIESNPERAEHVSAQLDMLTINGNGASLSVLERAGIASARLVLAVTSRDEVNVLACLAASRYEVEFKVARVSNPEYYEDASPLSRENLGIDLMINPERECAWETFQLLNSEAATDLARFADGCVQLIGLRVREGAAVADINLADLDRKLEGHHYVTVGIVRNGTTMVPTGSTRIEAGDQIFVLTPTAELPQIPPLAGYHDFKLKRVMIAGGSEEGLHLARHLEQHGVNCTVLDTDRRRCLELAELLPRSLILNADATNLELMEMEGVEGVDGFVAFTGNDQTNMLASLIAKTAGARKVISLIHKFEYMRLVTKVGIDAAVSARQSTVNAILRYVRRGNVQSVATLKGIDAEALELRVAPSAAITRRSLAEVGFPDHAVIGAIIRRGEVIMPRGHDIVQEDDRVIVFALADAIPEIERLFA